MKKIYLPKHLIQAKEFKQIIQESNEIQQTLEKLRPSHIASIICLSGDYGAGKDIWASLINAYFEDSDVFRFSENLRKQFNAAGFSDDRIDANKRLGSFFPSGSKIDEIDVSNLTFRDALIRVAEETKRIKGHDFYAKPTVGSMYNAFQDGKNLLILTDMRFEVERDLVADFAKSYGLFVERLHIPTNLPKIEVLG